jgi:RNA polymerase sigma factor (TIGR02999 family)
MREITRLLEAASEGDPVAREELFRRVYDELRILARQRLSRESTLTDLDAGSLVHEAYLRLSRQAELPTAGRRAFFAYASSVMRSVIVDYVRQREAAKRGAGAAAITLVTHELASEMGSTEVSALHEALDDLKRVDPRCAQLVEMRFFGGLEFEEIADILEVSRSTISRDWDKARLFLFQALKG